MNQKTLERLEYPRILELLAERTSFAVSKELALQLEPSVDIDQVELALRETTEARNLLDKVGEVNTGGLRDIRTSLDQIKLGRTLEPTEYLEMRDCLQAMTRLGRYLRQLPADYPTFVNLGAGMSDLQSLADQITKIFDEAGEVKDSASPKLRSIRTQIKTARQRIRDKLAALIGSPELQKHLQDTVIAVRGDRYVIPVKSESKSAVPGVIHDRSASGATIFVEPLAVVEINNALRELQLAETEEIARILRELNDKLLARLAEIRQTLFRAAEIDFLLAKGRLSQDLRCSCPQVNRKGMVTLRQARHPLLRDAAIPIDIQVGDGFRLLVITGPNTGGKTVTLKTVGLLTLMAQAGLHLPAAEGTEVSVFSGVYCDIGDEQSIEQNLSTFSGHISNISAILREVNANSLVLLDELGAGTDPQEGAALAIAILDYLLELKCTGVVTTHYSELKTYAHANPLIENASMEFDATTLSPTFRVILGLPGKSNALEIATRLGLPKQIIERARQARVGLSTELDEVLGEIGEELKLARRAREEAEAARREAEQLRRRYEQLSEELETKRAEILAEARREAKQLLDRSRASLEEAVRLVKEEKTAEAIKAGRRTLEEVTRNLKLSQELRPERDLAREAQAAEFAVGDKVYIRSLRGVGTILETNPAKKEALVQAGQLKVTVPFKDLSEAQDDQTGEVISRGQSSSINRVITEKRLHVPSELMVRGMTVEEAWAELDKYLDDALLAGYESVRLIHGKGEGILRSALRQRLAEHAAVKRFEEAAYNQGGSGVTVIYLRQ